MSRLRLAREKGSHVMPGARTSAPAIGTSRRVARLAHRADVTDFASASRPHQEACGGGGNDRYLRIPAIGSVPGGNSFTALLFGRLYGRRIKLYRGILLRRAVPSFTVELRRRPRLATNSSQNPRLSETKILQAPFERGSPRVAAAAFEANASTSPANVAPAQATGRILQCLNSPPAQSALVCPAVEPNTRAGLQPARQEANASQSRPRSHRLRNRSE